MPWYLDSSVAVHTVLPDGDPAANDWLDEARRRDEVILSATLLRLEVTRVLRRDRLSLDRADALLGRVNLIKLEDNALTYAARIEPHVRSLDAIHLAVAMLSGLLPVMVTHDGNMADVAKHLGLESIDPLAG